MTHARATIHISNIADNWRLLDGLHPDAETAAVVKADGYGHGAAEVAATLQEAGCQSFFVATMGEAVSLRIEIGEGSDIFVLNGANEADMRALHFNGLTPVLNTLDQIRFYRAESLREITPACLHFDTGMNRLGMKPDDARAVKTMLDGRPVGWVMTHLACADEPDSAMNAAQLSAFETIRREWPDAVHSIAATAGCYLGPDYGLNMVRPGIGLYGGGPAHAGLKPGLTLEAPILSLFEGKRGETTGYGATHTLRSTRRLATVALGYADGMLRALSNCGFGYIDGQRVPIVGRVSMDLITLDVSNVTFPLAPGIMVEFLGASAHLEEQAKAAGTLGYELITGLSTRVQRIYQS